MNTLHSYEFEGFMGLRKMQNIMTRFHESAEIIGHKKVLTCLDYSKGLKGLAKSNVLKYVLEDNCSVAVCPFGTEPRLNIYITTENGGEADKLEFQIAEDLKTYF